MNELNAEQIKKALGCCYMQELEHNENCPECPYTDLYPNCSEYLGKDALALINERTEKIVQLLSQVDCDKAEITLLRKHIESLGETIEMQEQEIYSAKADTVQKMQERLAVHFGTYTDKDMVKIREVFRLIDQIEKEMLEDMG